MNNRGSALSTLLQYSMRLKQHWRPALLVFSLFFLLAGILALVQKSVYEAEGKIVLKRLTPTSTLTQVGQEVDRLDPLTNLGNPALTETEIIQSTPVIQAALRKLSWQDDSGDAVSVTDFQRSLTVSTVNAADIIKITFKDKSPSKAAAGVNQVIEAYMANKVRGNQEDIQRTRQFVEKQLPDAEADLKQAETALRQFKLANQLLDLGDKVTSTEGRINELQRQISDNRAQLANTQAQMASTAQKIGMSPDQAIAIASLSQSPEIQDTVKDIQTSETELVQARNRFTDNHPTVVQLQNNIANLKALLRQKSAKILGASSGAGNPDANLLIGALKQDLSSDLVRLDSTRQGLEKQISDLSTTLDAERAQSVRLPRLVQKQNDLERKVQAAQTSYNTLLQKLKETQIAENQTQGNAKVVAWAIPPEKPAGLTKGILLGIGGVLGIFAGAATAYFLEATNRRVRSVEDAQYLFDLKVLGVIPMSERSRNLLFYDGGQAYHIPEVAVRDKPGSPTCEAYRLLQSNLKSNGTRRTKVLVVVSSIPQEGTSTVCANLAAAIAQSGRRVLLVDANLHNSVQGEIWYIPHMEGLSNILAEEVSFWTAVHNVATNLDVLPAGNAEVLPSALLDSAQMELVIDHCASLYDAVILDTPALTVSADATLLANLADSGILVVRPELLDIENALAAQGILEQWGEKMMGMVINGAPMGQFTYSYDTPELKDSTYSAVATIPVVPLAPSAEPDLPWLPLDAATEDAIAVRSPENLTLTDLDKMSASELKALVEALSQDWLRSTRLIQEQEAELDLQSQTVSELQERLSAAGAYHRHAANEYDRLSLEVQLADGEERKRLLDQTLMGQRRRLREQHDLLKKALQMMREKLMVSSSPDPTGTEPRPDYKHPEV